MTARRAAAGRTRPEAEGRAPWPGSILTGTKRQPFSWWARAGAIGVVAVAAIGVVDHFGAPTRAGVETPPADAVSVGSGDGTPLSSLNTQPAMSSDGSIVAFVADRDGSGVPSQVVIRDRATDSTTAILDSGPATATTRPAVSGDGCVVAYLAAVAADPADATSVDKTQLRAVDRCASSDSLSPSILIAEVEGIDPLRGAPAVSSDGSTIVWSSGKGLVRGVKFTSGAGEVVYLTTGFDPIADAIAAGLLTAESVTGPGIDVSADGAVVAFVAGPGAVPFAPEPPDVYVWTAGDPASGTAATVELASTDAAAAVPEPPKEGEEAPKAGGSYAPALSADGSILLYESTDTGLEAASAADPATLTTPFIAFLNRGVGTGVLKPGARNPAISDDGHHALYDAEGALKARWWSEGSPFILSSEETVFTGVEGDPTKPGESVSGASVSKHGRIVVFDTAQGVALSTDARFETGTHVWANARTQSAGGDPVDLGTGELPATLTGTATLTNTGTTGIEIASVAADAPFSLVTTTCAGVLQPGVSCTADVSVVLTTEGRVMGQLKIAGTTTGAEFTIELLAGADPTTTTSTSTSTTLPATTIPGSANTAPVASTNPPVPTLPVGTAPDTIATIPVTQAPSSGSGSSSGSSGGSSSGSGSSGGSTGSSGGSTSSGTTTTTTIALPVVFDPSTFDFAPTIVDAGRRVASLDLFNPSNDPVSVGGTRIEPADGSGFVVGAADCIGTSIPSGGRCSVEVVFAPTAEGPLTAELVAELSDGTQARATLSGVGAPPPTLTATPDVAAAGQAVTVQGAGFPGATQVVLTWDRGALERTVTTDDVGVFVETLIVLPNTRGGPSQFTVAGQADLFGDTTADLLVDFRGSSSNSAFLSPASPASAR